MKRKNASADRYVYELNPDDSIIMDVLRDCILNTSLDIVEVYKYKCPFYEFNGPLCYLSFEKKTHTVILGFIHGYKLEDTFLKLSSDLKQVRKLYFKTVEELNEKEIQHYVKQAIEINSDKKKKA